MGFIRVASRLGEAVAEKCPNCKMVVQNFGVVNKETWVCYRCGTHFTPKSVLIPERNCQKARLREQDAEKIVALKPKPDLECPDCGKACKSNLGLHSHMRTHKKAVIMG